MESWDRIMYRAELMETRCECVPTNKKNRAGIASHLGKAQLAAEVRGKNLLRGMVGDSEAGGNSYNMLCSCSPESLINFAANQLVERAIVHLRGIDQKGEL
jgi:hypothetical protein